MATDFRRIAEVKVFYSDTFELPLPALHRFPMTKYRLLRERISAADREETELLVPNAATDEQLALVHLPDYIHRVAAGELSDLEIRRIGFPWSLAMVERSRRSVGASIDAGRAACNEGISVNLAGGTHHAFPDSGQGYCIFNDVAVAARVLQNEGLARRVLFIDLDVHQGNGTAAITDGDDSLFSFSIHCDRNYPFRKGTSDLDVGLKQGTGDQEFLDRLEQSLSEIDRRFEADFVFYLAGADPFAGDRLGLLALSKSGLVQRDRMVFEHCRQRNIPCAISMSGGYASQIDDIVDIHFGTVMTALEFCQPGATTGTNRRQH